MSATEATDEQFREFVREHSRRLLHIAELLTGDVHRAEDLVQTALARAYPRWGRIRPEDAFAYVRASVVNASRDWWRRGSWREGSPETRDRADGVDVAAEHAQRDAVLRELAALTRKERAVIVLRFYEDLSEAAVADQLGIAPGTVKSTTARALAKLRCAPTFNPRPQEA